MADKPTSNLAVLVFEGQDTAQALYEQIEQMQKEKLVSCRGRDHPGIRKRRRADCTPQRARPAHPQYASPPVSTESGTKVTVKQTHGKKGKYAAIAGGIGLLAGAIFGGPIGLATIGTAGVGAIVGALRDFGIDDKSVEAVKQRLRPNTSALAGARSRQRPRCLPCQAARVRCPGCDDLARSRGGARTRGEVGASGVAPRSSSQRMMAVLVLLNNLVNTNRRGTIYRAPTLDY
jgi:uncharacterized membrane protein